MAMSRSVVPILVISLLALTSSAIAALQTGLLGARVAHIQTLNAALSRPAEHFASWVTKHGKDYANDGAEHAKRFAIWTDNLKFAAEYNSRTKSHWIGLNPLADLTQVRLIPFASAPVA